jgi:hypothetical protein
MRKSILTDKERQIINRYIESGEKLENFSVLVHRVRNMQNITNDLELINKFLSKIGSK